LDKVEAIRNIPEPKTKKALRSFLGSLSFYRPYIKDFSLLAIPLTNLTKSNVKNKIDFDPVERKTFNDLKEKLCASTVLQTPNYDKEFILHTDSSDFAVGGTLSQYANDGITLCPIAFTSKKLTPTQQRWIAAERESFAVIHCLETWNYILYGCKIILFTDSSPLTYIASSSSTSSKLCRWALKLQRFDVTIRHIAGNKNVVADMLSRIE
jgi:hypothetical protein